MKKIKLFMLAGLLSTVALHAQYFESSHGTAANEVIESGVNVSTASTPFFPGHIMAGSTDILGQSSVTVMRTDPTGSTTSGPPYFNNFIQYAVNNMPIEIRGRRVIDYTYLGDQILVWGDYTTTPGAVSDRFFLLSLSADGNTIFYTQDYQLPGSPPAEVRATSICASRMFPGVVYVCGWVQQVTGGLIEPIAMSIDGTTGNTYWSQRYSASTFPSNGNWVVNDLEESVTDIGGFSVALVGYVVSKIGASKYTPVVQHPCFNTIDALTGLPTSGVQTYGGDGAFNSINVAYGYTGSTPGFVMGGWLWSWTGQAPDMFAMRCDPYGMGVDFSQEIDFSYGPGPNWAYDVIERYSAANSAYEYYVGGEIFNDAAVIKLDATGTPVPNGEWTYGSNGHERAVQLDYYELPGDSSLSIFGSTNSSSLSAGGEDFYQLKAYFNGYLSSSCNVNMANSVYSWAYGYLTQYNVTAQSGPNPMIQLTPWAMGNQADFISCSGANTSGSNARMVQPKTETLTTELFPNPVSHENPLMTLQFNKTGAGEVQLCLRNTLGEVVIEKQEELGDGQTSLQFDPGKLESGIYLLTVNCNGHISTHRIVVE
jgi:hypothetical protein